MKTIALLAAALSGASALVVGDPYDIPNEITIPGGIITLTLPTSPYTTTTKCNADNCARAVTGTARGALALTSRLAACSSYQSCTVTPATSTVTVTSTTGTQPPPNMITFPDDPTTTFVPPITLAPQRREPEPAPAPAAPAALEARQRSDQCAKAPPAFASQACGTDGARFRSACACAGVAPTTTTQLAPVRTATTVVVSPSPAPASSFCSFIVFLGKGQSACKCDYFTSCGYAVCSLSQRLEGSFSMDSCRDACDARADCRGFTVPSSFNANFCTLCLSDDKTVYTNGSYYQGTRQRDGQCSNSQCNLPA